MNRRGFLALEIGMILSATLAGQAQSQDGWLRLGAKRITVVTDQDTVALTATEAVVTAIGLRVRGNDLFVGNVHLEFTNGDTEDIEVGTTILQDTDTHELELPGNSRIISAVTFTYGRWLNVMSETMVEVWGRP